MTSLPEEDNFENAWVAKHYKKQGKVAVWKNKDHPRHKVRRKRRGFQRL